MEIGRIRMRCHRLDDRFPQPHYPQLHATSFLFFNDDDASTVMMMVMMI